MDTTTGSICDDCGAPVPQEEPIQTAWGPVERRQLYCEPCYIQRVFDYTRLLRCPYRVPIARPKGQP